MPGPSVHAQLLQDGCSARARAQEPHGSMALSACVLYRCADAAAATAATGARHRRHATVSSASLRSSWWGRAIGHVGAHRFDAAIVSIAAPTGTVARKRRRIARQRAGRRAVCASAVGTPLVQVPSD